MPDPSYLPDFVLVVVAAWLGTTVLARTGNTPGSRPFAILSLTVAAWAAGWSVLRLSTVPDVQSIAGSITAVAGALLPALLVHLVLGLSARPWSPAQRAVVVLAYIVAFAFGGVSAFAEDNRAFGPSVTILGIPGPVLDWGWVAFRLAIMALAAWWIWKAQSGRGRENPRPQLVAMFGAVLFGALGGGVAIVLDQFGGPAWPGTTLLMIAFLFAAYATFRGGLFFAPEVARRILSYSLSGALLVAVIAVGVAAVDQATRLWLGFDSPLPVAVVLVFSLALFEPARHTLRRLFSPFRGNVAYRLQVALGADVLDAGPQERWDSVLAELGRSVGGSRVRLVDGMGMHRAGGQDLQFAEAELALQVRPAGQLLIGPKPSGLPFTPSDWGLLHEAAGYIGSSIELDQVTSQQAEALATLGEHHDAVRSQEARLSAILAGPVGIDDRLDVYALGPLHAERGGMLINRWGGAKAGTRQAEAMFAFLFDRGERGVLKDEIVEIVWPDADLERADLAFHRTLLGLRKLLGGRAGVSHADAIRFHNDRYRLNSQLIRWSDVAEFEEHLDAARGAEESLMVQHLEAARRLYRGDYLDDCPYYGDSSEVEDRRQHMRGRFTDVLLELAAIHERRGDRAAAAGYYRDALATNEQECPPAAEGLLRLQSGTAV